MDIAAAYEVLSDPDMRHLFDNGEDPLDAEAQSERNHHHHNPFGGGGFKFHQGGGGGGGGQRFHFNF